MKKILVFIAALLLSAATYAQTVEEIINKMSEKVAEGDTKGMNMIMEMNIPILGKSTMKSSTLGDKTYFEMTMMGKTAYNWDDGVTSWTYNPEDNELTIENAKLPSEEGKDSSDSDMELFDAVTDGYDATIESETDKVWNIVCKKQKTNTNKEDPKRIDMVISKADYMPVSLSTKMKGVKVVMRGFKVGVSESKVTFDPAKYPDATVIDKR